MRVYRAQLRDSTHIQSCAPHVPGRQGMMPNMCQYSIRDFGILFIKIIRLSMNHMMKLAEGQHQAWSLWFVSFNYKKTKVG